MIYQYLQYSDNLHVQNLRILSSMRIQGDSGGHLQTLDSGPSSFYVGPESSL